MQKTITGLAIAMIMATSVASANNDDNWKRASTTASSTIPVVTGQCMSAAIDKRDTAIITAHDATSLAIRNALVARKDGLKTAWSTITDKNSNKETRKAAWTKFKNDTKAAHSKMRTDRKAIWETFNTDAKACGVRDHGERAHSIENATYTY